MEVQKYDIQRPGSEGGEFVERFWRVLNVPLLGEDGYVRWILNCAQDVTELELFRRQKTRTSGSD
jgi:hypothetical protein